MNRPLSHFSILLALLAVAAIVYGVAYHAVASESSAVATLEGQIRAKTDAAARIAAARSALAEISGDEAAVQGYFVSEADVVPFIDDLESRGSSLGAEVRVVSVSVASAGLHPTLALALTASGPFDAVMRTLGTIEYAPYAIAVQNVSVSESAKGQWHADMALIVGSAPSASATSTPAALPSKAPQPSGGLSPL